MKLHKLLTVNDLQVPIITDDVRLRLLTAGCAYFKVNSEKPLSGMVQFSMGFEPSALTPYFFGYIESSTTIDSQQQGIMCRELGAVLNTPMPIAVRHCTLENALECIYKVKKLPFLVADAAYSTKHIACINHMGMGYHLMDMLGHYFSIPQYIWQQQADNSIFVGSWQDSIYPSRPVDIPKNLFTVSPIVGKAKVPVLPALRPGVVLNGQILTAVEFYDSEMALTWKSNPWQLRGNDGS